MSRRNLAYLVGAGVALTLVTVALHPRRAAAGDPRPAARSPLTSLWRGGRTPRGWPACCACRPGRGAALLAGAVVIRLAALTPVAPSSDDLYRYAWDGRVQAAGIDPYRYPPAAPS